MKTMKTYTTKPSHVDPRWVVFDATDKVLGRLATEVSGLLQGKHKPIYARHILTGDFVIVVNVSKLKVTGNKLQQKIYHRHSRYIGSMREITMSEMQERYPDRILRAAVRGMLPKNTLGRQMLRRLKIYAGDSHPHGAQIKDMADMAIAPKVPEPEWPSIAEVQMDSPIEVVSDIREESVDEIEVEESDVAEAEAQGEESVDEIEVEESNVAEAEAQGEELSQESVGEKPEN